jgi:hypothetical protein
MAVGGADPTTADGTRKLPGGEVMAELQPDSAIAPLLGEGERLLAVRRRAVLERRGRPEGDAAELAGDLYLTSTRLVFLGRVVHSFDLADLAEVILYGPGLLIVTRGGEGVRLEVDRPGPLRREIAVARSATGG